MGEFMGELRTAFWPWGIDKIENGFHAFQNFGSGLKLPLELAPGVIYPVLESGALNSLFYLYFVPRGWMAWEISRDEFSKVSRVGYSKVSRVEYPLIQSTVCGGVRWLLCPFWTLKSSFSFQIHPKDGIDFSFDDLVWPVENDSTITLTNSTKTIGRRQILLITRAFWRETMNGPELERKLKKKISPKISFLQFVYYFVMILLSS